MTTRHCEDNCFSCKMKGKCNWRKFEYASPAVDFEHIVGKASIYSMHHVDWKLTYHTVSIYLAYETTTHCKYTTDRKIDTGSTTQILLTKYFF